MTLTEREKQTVLAVFEKLVTKPTNELHTFLGSYTIFEMQQLYSKMKWERYCKDKGIAYEDMTEEDFIDAYLRENEG